jgi:hypothetical protein
MMQFQHPDLELPPRDCRVDLLANRIESASRVHQVRHAGQHVVEPPKAALVIDGEQKCFTASNPLADPVKSLAFRRGTGEGYVVNYLGVASVDAEPGQPGSNIALLIFTALGILQFTRKATINHDFHG